MGPEYPEPDKPAKARPQVRVVRDGLPGHHINMNERVLEPPEPGYHLVSVVYDTLENSFVFFWQLEPEPVPVVSYRTGDIEISGPEDWVNAKLSNWHQVPLRKDDHE